MTGTEFATGVISGLAGMAIAGAILKIARSDSLILFFALSFAFALLLQKKIRHIVESISKTDAWN